MKKLLLLALVIMAATSLAACRRATYEIALITDVGTIDDKSFNQGAWEGVVKYAEEFNISYAYYEPADKTTSDYIDAIELAINNGAKVVVTPGFLFENAIWVVQSEYPDVTFILLDGAPHNVTDWGTMSTYDGGDVDFTINDNVLSVFYAEEESGFLAGYAAVMDGYRNLGFMGGMAVPAVVRFGYGFVQGANYAANELGLADGAISLRYHYLGTFEENATYQTRAATWFEDGVEVIFAAAGGAGNSVMKAAEQESGKVIGVDIDQKDESTTVITSALKELANSVYDSLTEYYDGTFEGGRSVLFDASVDGVGLPDDFSRFTQFTKAQYDSVFAKLVAGTITILGDETAPGERRPVSEINTATPKVNVTVVE
ncbi:MAG: BMP family lipoprotein [Candidatus Izemoplasmataceae bacterium]|jgi:basic membrane protein A and related proteins